MTLSSALNISSEGLITQSALMKIYANNLANVGTPDYIRKIPVLAENNQATFQEVLSGMRHGVINTGLSYGPGGVTMAGVVNDPTPGSRIYEPGHPQADKDGYVTLSNVNSLIEMSDAMSTSRLYEANLAVVGIIKNMATRAVDIGRGG
jgi:flagellar basal-body rod protein FlgC